MLQLLKHDFLLVKRNFAGTLFNTLFWFGPDILIYNLIFPGMGMSDDYGVFVQIGSIITLCVYNAISYIPELLSAIEDNHSIYYYLTLPVPQWLILTKYALSFSIGAFLLSMPLLLGLKFVLWSTFSLANFSLFKYLLIMPLINIFIGFFTLLIASLVRTSAQYENAWMRIVIPLTFIGCCQSTWYLMLERVPWAAYLNLINPFTYCMEGFRAAILGHDGYINFWISLTMLTVMIGIVAYWGIRNMMKRLDCI